MPRELRMPKFRLGYLFVRGEFIECPLKSEALDYNKLFR